MSNPDTLNSIIDKLLTLPNTYSTLYFNQSLIEPKIVELKKYVNDITIDEYNYKILATFLQYIDIKLFTLEELRFLLNLNYTVIENNSLVGGIKDFTFTKPMYDINGEIFNNIQSISEVEDIFTKLHSLNKNLNVAFLISLITTQI